MFLLLERIINCPGEFTCQDSKITCMGCPVFLQHPPLVIITNHRIGLPGFVIQTL